MGIIKVETSNLGCSVYWWKLRALVACHTFLLQHLILATLVRHICLITTSFSQLYCLTGGTALPAVPSSSSPEDSTGSSSIFGPGWPFSDSKPSFLGPKWPFSDTKPFNHFGPNHPDVTPTTETGQKLTNGTSPQQEVTPSTVDSVSNNGTSPHGSVISGDGAGGWWWWTNKHWSHWWIYISPLTAFI